MRILRYAACALMKVSSLLASFDLLSRGFANEEKQPTKTTVLNDYHEALELFAYERMFVACCEFYRDCLLLFVFTNNQTHNEPSKKKKKKRSLVKLEGSDMYFGSGPKVEQKLSKNGFDIFTTRLMLVVISSLAKLAARWQDLASRVLLCLAKIMRHQHYFDPVVLVRANECMQLLKFPRWATSTSFLLPIYELFSSYLFSFLNEL